MAYTESSFFKFPKTPHLAGSRLGEDDDIPKIPFSHIIGKRIVIEEKIDGANVGISFGDDGALLLQNRGHYFYGGYKERHYDLFKRWANENSPALFSALGSRYILFGEWMFAKHTVFYDMLPSYFIEFDVYDKENCVFLDTGSRRNLLKDLSIPSVPVLGESIYRSKDAILSHLGISNYISNRHIERLKAICEKMSLDASVILSETDLSRDMEGLYIKIEEDGKVIERMKFVRGTYVQSAKEATSRWQSRPIIPNQII